MKSQTSAIEKRINERLVSARKESIRRLGDIEHRLEFVDEVEGVEFVNDAKATDLNSTWYSLESMSRPVVWILSSSSEKEDYALMSEVEMDKIKAFVIIGHHHQNVLESIGSLKKATLKCDSILEATIAANEIAVPGDVVLFSPAFTDLDNYSHYKENGQLFRKAVREMRLK